MTTKSILQPWVTELPLRYQGTLLTVIRACDDWSKYAIEKSLIREMRGLILVPCDARELAFLDRFMTAFPDPGAAEAFQCFLNHIDPLPVHYVMHVVHAIEILGYEHPHVSPRQIYLNRYLRLAQKFHFHPERSDQLRSRMTEDRIANGTVGQ